MSTHELRRAPHREVPEHEVLTLVSPAGLAASFVPTVGMVGCSLTDDGVELLGQRGGITDYLARGKTFGIPLLAPWANRLHASSYVVLGREVTVSGDTPGAHRDANGLPMHGLFGASPDWVVVTAEADEDAARLVSRLDHGPSSSRWPGFPFAHRLEVTATLSGRVLRIETSLVATGGDEVPVAFGWHPYLQPADPPTGGAGGIGAPRATWVVSPPSDVRAELDDWAIPTGELVTDPSLAGALGARTFDDLLAQVRDGATGVVRAGRRRIEVRYERGYPWAVLYAPADPPVVCLEVMTAPTDPFGGHWPVRSAAPGGAAVVATFALELPPVGSLG